MFKCLVALSRGIQYVIVVFPGHANLVFTFIPELISYFQLHSMYWCIFDMVSWASLAIICTGVCST